MRIRRQLQLGFGVVALGFALGCLLVLAEIGKLGPATERLSRDESISYHAVRLERGARKLEAGVCLYDRRQSGMARQLMTEGRDELAASADVLSTLVRDPVMAAAVDDVRGIAGSVVAGARAAAARSDDGGVTAANRRSLGGSGATLDSRTEALRVELESLVAMAHRRLVDTRETLVSLEQRIRHIVLFSMIALALVGLVAAGFLARRVVGRLSVFAAGAERLGRGDLTGRIPSAGADELGELARAFNRMVDRLSQAQGRLVESERLAAIGQVAVAVRHEVANPLQGLLGAIEILRTGTDSPEQVADLLAAMAAEGHRIGETMVKLGSVESSATRTYVGGVQMLDLGGRHDGDRGDES